MRSLLVILALVGLALGDVSHLGYQYRIPHTSYGVPAYQTGSAQTGYQGQSGQTQTGYQGQAEQTQTGYQGQTGQIQTGYRGQTEQTQTGYQGQTGQTQTGYQGQTGQSQTVYQGQTSGSIQTQQAPQQTSQQPTQYVYNNVGTQSGRVDVATSGVSQTKFQTFEKTSAQNYQQQYYQVQHQTPQVFKHFFYHSAPEEPEVPQIRNVPVVPPPQKHYNVIFIKAPAQRTPPAPVVPIQHSNEEKTIVYVLSKTPEEPTPVVLPKVENKQPSKPEVYFIKYSGQEDSQAVINNIVKEHGGNTFVSQSSGSGLTSGSSNSEGNSVSTQVNGGVSDSGSYVTNQGTNEGGNVHYVQGQYIVPNRTYQSTNEQATQVQNAGQVSQAEAVYANADQKNTYQTNEISQGLPHATYGPPNFRS